MSRIKIIWTNKAKMQLKEIYQFYKEKSPQAATTLMNDILKSSKDLVFTKQYQQDEIEPDFRRIIVRQYKLIYTTENTTVYIKDF